MHALAPSLYCFSKTLSVCYYSFAVQEVKSYDQCADDLCNDASVALILEYFKSVISYVLPSQFCQSTLNGRNGSNACTVISICVATQIMLVCVQVPDSGTVEPSQQTIRAFVACIE